MIKPILRSIASTETVDVPKFRFMEYRVGETYHNNESFIDFVTDGNELYVCAVDTVVASANKISDQANMLKLVSKGEPGRDGAEGRQGLPGHAPNIYAKFEGDQLSIYADGRRIATTTGITGPAWKPKKINNTITWERSFDDEIPASINLNELRSDDYTPILLRANSDNTKRDDETSGPANFIQWKYEGQEEWSNLISISELMNLALAGVSIWLDENDGQYHLGHREVVKASYASSPDGPQIISDVELGEVLFDAGAIPTIGGGIDPEELEERLQEIIAMIPDVTEFATKTWVNNQGFLKQHQDLSDYVKSVNGQTPDNTGNVTLSVAGNPIMELRIQNQELQKKSVNDSNWVTVGSVGGGSGQGCDRCWSQQEIIDLILNQLSPYGNKSWVLEEITKAITGTLEVEYFRVFTLYKRTNSRTTAPTSPTLNEWTWNTETGVIESSSQNPAWSMHPENASVSTPYLWMASATFSSATKKEFVPQGASNGWTLVCLTGEPGQDGANGYDGTDGADGKGIEFIYHLGSAAPLIKYTTAYKDGYAPKDFDTEIQAKAWWHTLESEDWLPWDGSSNNGHWNDHPESVSDEEGKRIEYASVRTCKYNSVTGVSEWSDFSDPFIWSMWGEDGVDGDGVEYIFFVSATQITPVQYPPIHLYNIYNNSNNQPVSSDALIDYNFPKSGYENYQNSEWRPNGWTDNPSDVDAQQPYEYVSIRKYNGATGKWGAFSIPKLWRMLKVESAQNFYQPYTEFAFTRTSLDLTGYLVTGGQSYSDPLEGITTYDDSNPRQKVQITWTDGVPTTSNDPIWCITALIGDEDQQQNAEWTGPWLLKDSTGFQVEYSKSDAAAAVYADPTLLPSLNSYKDPTDPYEGIDETAWETAVQLAGYGIWNDNVVDPVYMATAVLGKDGTWSDWVVSRVKGEKGIQGDPGVGTDGSDSTGVEFVYYRTKGTKPGIDNTKGKYPGSESEVSFDATKDDWMPKVAGLDAGEIDGTSYWKDHPTGVDSTWTHEWCIARTSFLNNKKRNWPNYFAANIALWSKWAVDGRDGDGVEYVYHLADVDQYNVPVEPDLVETAGQVRIGDVLTEVSESNNWKPAGSNIAYPPSITQEFYPSDGTVDGYWTDDPTGVSSSHPYEYVSVRKYDGINKVWGEFSTPAIWSKYGEDGKTRYTSHIFTRAIGVNENCTLSNTTVLNEIVTRNSSQNVVTATWTDTIPSTGGVVWMATGVISNGQLENGWSSPCRIGDDVNIQFEFCASEDNDETLPDLNATSGGEYIYLDGNLDPIEGSFDVTDSGFRYKAYIDSQNHNIWGDEDDITDPVWMAISHRVGGVWSSWIYSRIKGEKGDTGEPGTSVRIVHTVQYATDLKNFVDAGPSSSDYPNAGDCYIVLEGVLNPRTTPWGQINPTDPDATYSSSHIWAFGGAVNDPTDDTNIHLAGFDDLGEFANVTPDKIFIRFAEENDGSAETDTIHTVNVFISGQTVSKHLEMLSVSQSGPFIGIYTGQSSSEVITDYKWSKWDGDDYYGFEQIFLKLEESKTPVWPLSSIIGASGTDTGRIKGLRKKNPINGEYDINVTPVDVAHYSEFDVVPVVQVSTNILDDQCWVDTPQEIYDNTTVKYNLWQCTRNIATGVYDWSEPVIYNKYVRDGVDGKFEESVYFRNNTGATPAMSKRFAADENNVLVKDTNNTGIFNKVDVRPYATTSTTTEPTYGITPIWTDNPEGVADDMRYEFISTRKISYNENNEPIYGAFSDPKLLSRWGENGKDGDGIEYVFFALTDTEHNRIVNDASLKRVDDSGTYNNKSKDSSEFLPKLTFTRTVGNNQNVEIRATDDNPGVTQTYTHIYASIRRYRWDPQTKLSSWGPFSDIALWLVATSEVRKTALLDITNDMEPVWVDSSYHANSSSFDTGFVYLRSGNTYDYSIIDKIKINDSEWINVSNGVVTPSSPILLDGNSGPKITYIGMADLKQSPNAQQFVYSFSMYFYVDIPTNYTFNNDIPITISAKDREDYVGTSIFILHPVNATVKVELLSKQQLIKISEENAVDYSTNEVSISPFFKNYVTEARSATPETGLPFNIAKNVKYYLAIDGNIDTAFTAQGGQYYTFTIANETVTKEQSGFYPPSALYGFSINGSNTEMSASSTSQGYNTLLRLTNIDNDDKDNDMWSVSSILYLNTLPAALKPKRNVIVGVGYANEGVFDKAEIPIIWNGKDGTNGRGIASVEHKFLSIASEHFNAAKEAPDTERIIATAFYDDDIWGSQSFAYIYTQDLIDILDNIVNEEGLDLYGESQAVNEDPRTAGTFTIERVTTTYTDNTTDVQYIIIDHLDDVSYLVGAFGEDVDHQNGAILRNFLGVSKTTDRGTNVKAFLNADPNIARQGTANTLMIAAGIPSSGGSFDARSNAATFRVYENGEMHATSGSIGGLTIDNGALKQSIEDFQYDQLGKIEFELDDTNTDQHRDILLGHYFTPGVQGVSDDIFETKLEMNYDSGIDDDNQEYINKICITPDNGIDINAEHTDGLSVIPSTRQQQISLGINGLLIETNMFDGNTNQTEHTKIAIDGYGISWEDLEDSNPSTNHKSITWEDLFTKLNSI